MKLVFISCSQSGAVDATTNLMSLFHILEQIQSAAFPSALPSLTLGAIFSKEQGDADSNSLRLRIALGDAAILDTALTFSFQGRARGRLMAAINGLAVPGPGVLSFSILSDSGQNLGSWDVIVEQATTPSQASAPTAA